MASAQQHQGHLLVQGDLLSLKQGVQKQLQQLNINAAAAANSVALLKEVDKVKGRMEAACSTLKVAQLKSNEIINLEAECGHRKQNIS